MRNILIIGLGLVAIIAIVAAVVMMGRKGPVQSVSASASAQPTPTAQADKLQITDTVVGTGTEATNGKSVTVNYTGTLTDGTKFDSSYDRNQPFTFTLGNHEVISGWDQGVLGMKVGGKRHLVIPAALGYGSQSMDKIPANSTLVFDIELLGVQ